MEDNKYKKALYDQLSNKVDFGTYEDFERNISEDDNFRKALYDIAKQDIEVGEYADFESNLNVKKKVSPLESASKGETILQEFGLPPKGSITPPLQSESDKEEPIATQEETLADKATVSSVLKSQQKLPSFLQGEQKRVIEESTQAIKDEIEKLAENYRKKIETNPEKTKELQKEFESEQNRIIDLRSANIPMAIEGVYKKGRDYKWLEPTDVKELSKVIREITDKPIDFIAKKDALESVKKDFMSKVGAFSPEEQASIERELIDVIARNSVLNEEGMPTVYGWKQEVLDKKQGIREAFNKLITENPELENIGTDYKVRSSDKGKEYLALIRANDMYDKVLSLPDDDGNFWQGFKSQGRSLLTAGMSDLFEAANITKILKKQNRGEELSTSEQAMVDAYGIYQATQGTDEFSKGYKRGQGMAGSVAFMETFVLTGVPAGVGEKTALRLFGNQIKNKVVQNVVKGVGSAVVRTPLLPMGATETVRRMGGSPKLNEEGEWKVDPSTIEPTVKAIGKGLYSNFANALGETAGGWLSGTKVSSVVAKGLGLNKIPKSVAKIFNAIGMQPLGELPEEYLTTLMETPVMGDQTLKEAFSAENVWETAVQVGMMSGFFSGLALPSVINENVQRARNKEMIDLFGKDKVSEIRSAIENKDKEAFKTAIGDLTESTDVQKKQLLKYVSSIAQENGANVAQEAAKVSQTELSVKDKSFETKEEMPNGYGTFADAKDLRESKEVVDIYVNAEDLSDAEVMKDFVSALRGRPTTWYADGLKLRESMKEASQRGITFETLINKAKDVYTKDGYTDEEGLSVVKGMLDEVFKSAKKPPTGIKETEKEIKNFSGLTVQERNGVKFAEALPDIMNRAFAIQKPFKDVFLKSEGLTSEKFDKLPQTEKDKLQEKWPKSREFKQMEKHIEEVTLFLPKETVFHGTPNNITEFNSENGVYFTPNKKYAEHYKGQIQNPNMPSERKLTPTSNIVEAKIDIRNPKLFGKDYTLPTIKSYYELTPDKIAEYKKQGYDGLIFVVEGKVHEYVVFDKSQIKTKKPLVEGEDKKPPESTREEGGGVYNKKAVIDQLITQIPEDSKDMMRQELASLPIDEFNKIATKAGFNSMGSHWTLGTVSKMPSEAKSEVLKEETPSKGVTPPTKEKVPEKGEKEGGDTKFRKTQINSLIQDQTLQQQEVAKIVDKNKERYNVLHGENAVKQAKKIIDEKGVQAATLDLSERTRNMDEFPVRQTARQVLLDFYSRAIVDKNASEADKEVAFRHIDNLQYITAKEATKAGQGSAMLAIWKSLQPSGVLEYVRRKIEQSNNKILEQKVGNETIGGQIDELYNTLTEESKKIIDDIIAGKTISILTTERVKTPTPKKTVPRERIKKEQDYRKSLIEQYKKSQGSTMAMSAVGLTSTQIELGGNLLGSYVREGYYRTEDFIDNLKRDFRKIGVTLNDKQTDELLSQQKDAKESFKSFAEKKESTVKKRAGEKLLSDKINGVLKEHWSEKDELKRTLSQKLIDEAGLTETEAKKIEKQVLTEFDSEIVKRSEKLLTKLIGTTKIPTTKAKKGLMGRMIDLINLGALDEGVYRDLFSEKFKLTKLTDTHKEEILRLANNVQEVSGKGWLERDATIKLAKYIFELYPTDQRTEVLNTWISLAYANMLMGMSTTVLNTWSQGWNMSLKPVRDLTNLSKWLKTIKKGVKGEGFDVYNPFGEMFYSPMIRGTKIGWNEAKEVYINGDLNNKYVEDVAKKGQFNITPLERNKYGKSQRFKPLNIKIGSKVYDLNLFNKYKYSGRNLAAQDKFMLAASYDTEIVGILRDNLRTKNLTGRALTKAVMEIYHGDLVDMEKIDAQIRGDALLHKKLTGEDMTEIQKKIRRRELMLEELPLTTEERDEAEMLARSNIFTDDRSGFFGTLAEGLSIAANSHPVAGIVIKPFVPFTKIVGNVAEYMLDHTPLYGFMRANGMGISAFKKIVNSEWNTSQMGEKGSRAYYEQMGRAWLGTMAFSLAMMMFLGNDDEDYIEISGGYSAEGFKKAGRTNVMPKYTLRIGSVKIPYMNIPGLAVPLGIIGNLNDGLKMKQSEGDLSDRLTAALLIDAGLQSVTMIKDMSFVDGVERLATLVGNVASTDEKKWGQIGKDVTKSYLGFMTRPLPQNNNAIQQIWKIFDPTSYSQADIKSILAYSAGLQHFVNTPNIDQLGDEVQTYPGETLLPYTHWLNIKGQDKRWMYLSKYNAIPTKTSNRVFQIETKDGIEKRKLEPQELYDYTKRAGTLFSNSILDYMEDQERVSKRAKEIIEREKTNGETERITGIQEDTEKLWSKAKKDAETELFRWGSVKEEMPKVWDLMKKHQAYQIYQTTKSTDGYTWNKSELYEFNNMATLRYAEKIEKYLLSKRAEEDKNKFTRDGVDRFTLKIDDEWSSAKEYVSRKLVRTIKNKIREQQKNE